MNEIVLEIAELEEVVNKLKTLNKPESILAIRTIDVMIERKKSQLEAFERTFGENWFLSKMDRNRYTDYRLLY